jgi:hypothetical protein
MGYINDFISQLRTKISEGKIDEAVRYAADTCLESYRNGMKAANAEEGDVRKANRYAKRAKGK